MPSETVTRQIRKFLVERFPQARHLSNDDALLDKGVVDSLGILEIVAFLEQAFHMTVADEELLPENFQSVERLATFVQSKVNGASVH
jgi:acyl carrier protein